MATYIDLLKKNHSSVYILVDFVEYTDCIIQRILSTYFPRPGGMRDGAITQG